MTNRDMVNTALGPISADKIGRTLVHEHICFQYPGWYSDNTIHPYDRQEAETNALRRRGPRFHLRDRQRCH